MTYIPKMLHQLSKDYDDEVKNSRDSFTRYNPDWDYKFWSDEDCDALVRDHYPDFYSTWCGFDRPIKKWDSIRSLILHHHGGMYIDVDVLFYGSISDLIADGKQLIFREPVRDQDMRWRSTSIRHPAELNLEEIGFTHVKNHFMASSKENPFWIRHIDYVKRVSEEAPEADVFDHTGGDSLAKVLVSCLSDNILSIEDIQFIKHNYFINEDFVYEEAPLDFDKDEVRAIHFCKASWFRERDDSLLQSVLRKISSALERK